MQKATETVPQQDRPNQGIRNEQLREARLLARQGQQCEKDMDDGNGQDGPVPPTGAECLLGARECPGENQNRREFQGHYDGKHPQNAPVLLNGLRGLDGQRTVRVRR